MQMVIGMPSSSLNECAEAEGTAVVAQRRCGDVIRTQPRTATSSSASSMISTVPCSIIIRKPAYPLDRTYQSDSLAITARTRMSERRFS
ncbi:hypothetical protein M422DRAFT_25930 [Sphaerobolus stellatus SS14]|nr:hypothetical protein M422DRAFT_25930 [Sphaerobolus stellatus SS14]